MVDAHFRLFETYCWYVHQQALVAGCYVFSLSVCKAEGTGTAFPASLKTLYLCCIQGKNTLFPFFILFYFFFGITVFLKIRHT